jgi:hypothetical protein
MPELTSAYVKALAQQVAGEMVQQGRDNEALGVHKFSNRLCLFMETGRVTEES